ncbi:nuclear transport factor 2 family protein [Streptomyces sp. NBC_00080]|uniref:nuclear transport factor 2 family protein n=1 Tax=Streptomyces TaxID=1883 RepID=UPI001E43836F|nr:nuclear transport factor 2 family protein [Streptomyces coriariae]
MTTTTTQTDHIEISMLVSRFFRALDERKFEGDWARDYVTDDVRTTTPIGAADGAEAMAHAREALERYARTQHIASDVLVDVEPASGRATASWNALMTHVHHDTTLRQRGEDADPLFTVGGYWEAELRREREGWRISRMSVQALWTTGRPPEPAPEIRPAPVV